MNDQITVNAQAALDAFNAVLRQRQSPFDAFSAVLGQRQSPFDAFARVVPNAHPFSVHLFPGLVR